MLETNKKQADFLYQAIDTWQHEEVLTEEAAEKLRNNILVQPFDWALLAKYAFLIAIICVIGAVLALVSDTFIIQWLFNLIGTEWGAVVFSMLIALVFFYWGGHETRQQAKRKFSREALLAIGGIFIAVAVGFFGNAIDSGSGHFSILFLLAATFYAPLLVYYRSIALWLMFLLTITLWLGFEMEFWSSNYDWHFGGSHYFISYLGWGALVVGASHLLKKSTHLAKFAPLTYAWGLLLLFFNLWLLSLDWFSNWQHEGMKWGWLWAVVLALASAAALVWGIKKEDLTLKVLGFGFFLLNIYTKYIQYLWDELHSTIFFSILAVSFWLIGSRAEAIWSGSLWQNSDDLLDNP